MGLLDGVQNFTPAFTGQQLALEAGSRLAAGFQRGVNNKNASRQMDLQEEKFTDEQKQREESLLRLNEFRNYTTGGEVPPGSVGKANHIISKLTADPSWLADPRTSEAANSVFAAASKVVSMNLQLERVKNSSIAAQTEQRLLAQQTQMLEDIAKTGPDGAASVAGLFIKDQDGNLPALNPSRFSEVAELYKKFGATSNRGVEPMDVRLIEKEDEYRRTGQTEKADLLKSILSEKSREKGRVIAEPRPYTITVEEGGSKVTKRLTEEEYLNRPVDDEKTIKKIEKYRDLKSKLSEGDQKLGPDWNPLASSRQDQLKNLRDELQGLGVDAETGKRITSGGSSELKSPSVGEVLKGYRFKGGDPADKNNWERAQ